MASVSIAALIFIAGLINFLPVAGVLSGEKIENLYGLTTIDATLEILLRHRAVLFGLLGGFMMWSAFRPALQTLAIIGGFAAMISFIGLFFAVGDASPSLEKIVIADFFGCGCLVIALVLMLINK
ncbi:MAG: phosphopantetheine adenylyltransferase [Pseudomonadota bacterium]